MDKYSPVTGLDMKVTNKCMLSCDFCVNSDGLENDIFIQVDKITSSLQEIITAPSELAELKAIYFTGGETLYGLDYIKNILTTVPQNIFTSIVTNGLMLNDKSIDTLRNLNISRVKVSYDTTNSLLLVDIRRGMKNEGLKLIENNIKKLVDSNILVYLRVALTKRNSRNLTEIYKKAVDLGIHTLQIKPVIYAGRVLKNVDIMLSYDELNNIFSSLADIYDENTVKVSISCYPPAKKFNLPVKNCANKDKLYLYINGDIYTCNYAIEKSNYLGNYLIDGGMLNALKERKRKYSQLFNDYGIIRNCPSILNYVEQGMY